MKTYILCALFGVMSNLSSLRGQSLDWASKIGCSDGGTTARHLTSTANGDLLIAGTYHGFCDMNLGPDTLNLPGGGNSEFIARYDSLGALIWAKQFEWNGAVSDFAFDGDGNIYITGSFQGTVDFDPGPDIHLASGDVSRDVCIIKLNGEGEFNWVRHFGSTETDEGLCISVDNDGNIYTSGIFRGSVDIDPGQDTLIVTAEGDYDTYLLKLDTNGELIWGKSMGWVAPSGSRSLDYHLDGTIIYGGWFNDSITFELNGIDTTLIAPGNTNSNTFISRFNSDGDFIWAKQIGSTSSAVLHELEIDPDGAILTTGTFWGTPDFDPGPETYFMPSGTGSATFITKLDIDGNFIWARNFVCTDTLYSNLINPNGLDVDSEGSVYTTGVFFGFADFNPPGDGYLVEGHPYVIDSFAAKLFANGDLAWGRRIGSSHNVLGHDIAALNSGKVVLCGQFQNQVDIAPAPETYYLNSNSFNETNAYLACWNQVCKGTLNGNSFFDLNSNSIHDEDEPVFENAIYSSTFTTGLFHGKSDGSFSVCVPSDDSVEIALINSPIYFDATPENYTGYVNEGYYVTGLDFALTPEFEDIFDLEIDFWSVLPNVPGMSTTYYISYNNIGPACVNDASIELVLDQNLTLDSVEGAEYTFDDNTITITIDSVCPFSGGEIHMEVLLSQDVEIDEQLTSQATILPIEDDANAANNEATLTNPVMGPYDPNDKSVNADTIYPAFLAENLYLEYLIRFQNVGNYYAQNVLVSDFLSPFLDQSSFQLLSASHNVEVSFHENEVQFTFDNIMLPDSATNEPESHGYIRFKIKPLDIIPVDETIENSAAIYFDYNDPIITNTTQTLLTIPVGIIETGSTQPIVYPNPTRGILKVVLGRQQPTNCYLTDVSGSIVKTIDLSSSSETAEFDVRELSPGLYFLYLDTQNGRHVIKWVKE